MLVVNTTHCSCPFCLPFASQWLSFNRPLKPDSNGEKDPEDAALYKPPWHAWENGLRSLGFNKLLYS